MASSYLLLIVSTVVAVTGQVAGQCNQAVLSSCLGAFGPAYLQGYFDYSIDATNIANACNGYSTANTCVTTQAMCKVTDTPAIIGNWTGASAFYSIVCTPAGQTAYLQYQPCYASPSYAANAGKCAASTNASSINVNSSPTDQCTAYNALIACIVYETGKSCNSPAAGDFLGQLIVATYGPAIHLGVPCCMLYADKTGYSAPSSCSGTKGSALNLTAVVLPPVLTFVGLIVVLGLSLTFATRKFT